jgi:tRNA (guanine-N7-)-methyltransferase
MSFQPRPTHPYRHAARLPEGDFPVKLDELFEGSGPVEIEIGPGRGGFVFERCAVDPAVRVLGFEIRLKWAHLVDERLAKAGLRSRARVLAGDAKEALRRLEPAGSVRAVFLHFPDPWWKKRHEKRLVMGDVLLDRIARLLEPGGALFIQTDVEERAEQYAAQVGAHEAFAPLGDREGSPVLEENPYGARSPREHRAIADGLPVHRMRWARKAL